MSRLTDARKASVAEPRKIDPDISEVLHLIGVLERRTDQGPVPAEGERRGKGKNLKS